MTHRDHKVFSFFDTPKLASRDVEAKNKDKRRLDHGILKRKRGPPLLCRHVLDNISAIGLSPVPV